MRSKNRLCLAVLAALVVGTAIRVEAENPEFAASFARATTALYEMINVPDGNGIPREALRRPTGWPCSRRRQGSVLIGGYSGDGVVTVRRPTAPSARPR